MQWAQKEKGFTIVELLIVIIVIAILAVITVVAYNGVTSRARSLALTNSLHNAADLVQIAASKGTPPTTFPSDVKVDNDVVLQLAASSAGPSEFCINAYRISYYEVSSFDSKTGKIQPYLCPGLLVGDPLGGSLPAVPLKTNLIASDFSSWTLTGDVTYDATANELTFNGTSGSALSPPVRLGGQSASATFGYELYSTSASVSFAPQAGGYSNSQYFGSDGVTPATSSTGYTSNGNAQAVPLNAWTAKTWTITTGPNVQYIQFKLIMSPTTYTSGNFKVRNPSISRQS